MVSALANPVAPTVEGANFANEVQLEKDLAALLVDKFGFSEEEAKEILSLLDSGEMQEMFVHLSGNPTLSTTDVMALFNVDESVAKEIMNGKDSVPVYGLPLSGYALLMAALFASDSNTLRNVMFKMFEKSESIARSAAKDIMNSGWVNLAGGAAAGLMGIGGAFKCASMKQQDPGSWWSPMGINVGTQSITGMTQGAGTVLQGRAQLTESEADPIRSNTQILQSIWEAYERKESEGYAATNGK